jgi:parallel beta-helix repeat protein
MKRLFTIIFFISLQAAATDYYFSVADGNDSRTTTQAQNSSTPWQSITKLNAIFSMLRPGDRVLLKKGETFTGRLLLSASGNSSSKITITSYSIGEKPIITGLQDVTGWTVYSGNIYQATVPNSVKIFNTVVKNNRLLPIGRDPNTGWRLYESFQYNGTVPDTIVDNQLTNAINWTGAGVVIKNFAWVLSRGMIIEHSGNRIKYGAGDGFAMANSPRNNYGYFFYRDIKTLDLQNEWHFNPSNSKIYMYSVSSPANVKVSVRDTLLYAGFVDHITIDGLAFQGANRSSLAFLRCSGITVRNCDIINSGTNAIDAAEMTNFICENNLLQNAWNNGIYLWYGNTNTIIKNNNLRFIGMAAGMGVSGDGTYLGMYIEGSSLIENNVLDSIGYNGIHFTNSSNITIRKNFINHFDQIKADGGGIYTYRGTDKKTGLSYPSGTNRKIVSNIIMNALGPVDGTDIGEAEGHGIYLDGNSANVTVDSNSIAYCNGAAIFQNDGQNNIIRHNTLYNCHHGYYAQDGGEEGGTARTSNLLFKKNIFYNKTDQTSVRLRSSQSSITNFGVIDSNYYIAIPNLTGKFISVVNNYSITNRYSLSGWNTATGYEGSSTGMPSGINTGVIELFLYNITNSSSVRTLTGSWKDAKGKSYNGTITLPAFSSAVLMKATVDIPTNRD